MEGGEYSSDRDPLEPDEIEEVLDGEIVEVHAVTSITAEQHTVAQAPSVWGTAPVQTAVAAATGFIAGAATLALLRRYGLARAAARELDIAADERLRRGSDQSALRGGTYLVSIRTLQPPQ